jgi:serine O-acetyltransferase
MCPPLGSLKIEVPHVGPGLFIQHGDNTFISAERIGNYCWIGRHVVVGYSNATDCPTIGNNVRIFPGAKIIGKIKVGDNATIGLNTVAIDNVPPNVMLLGVPGRVVSPNFRPAPATRDDSSPAPARALRARMETRNTTVS